MTKAVILEMLFEKFFYFSFQNLNENARDADFRPTDSSLKN